MSRSLEQVAELVRRESGVVVRPDQFESLTAAVARATAGAGPDALLKAAAAADPQARAEVVDRLLDAVTIKETFFFRETGPLLALDWHGLLRSAQAQGRMRVRVWSAACATGEEAYTLAILACEAFGTASPPVDVHATDIAPPALRRAREGRYGRRAVRQMDAALIRRHLESDGKDVVVGSHLRPLVEFAQHNLVTGARPERAPFDLIVCRNVLIYLAPAAVESAATVLTDSLSTDGLLVLGAADRLCWPRAAAHPAKLGAPPQRPRTARARRRPRARRAPAARADKQQQPPQTAAPPPALRDVLLAADEGRTDDAATAAAAALAENPDDPAAHFVAGTVQLALGHTDAAVGSLRRALYLDPTFALAAFKLARAHDTLGQAAAAKRAYEQALRTFDPDDERHHDLLGSVDVGNLGAACRMRIAALS